MKFSVPKYPKKTKLTLIMESCRFLISAVDKYLINRKIVLDTYIIIYKKTIGNHLHSY